MKARAVVAVEADKPLEVMEVDLDGLHVVEPIRSVVVF